MSGLGDDNSTCTRPAPCRTFAGAIGKTNAGGEVVVADAGGYGSFTIQKSISIISEGAFGGILGGAPGVLIDAPGANVVLHGLMLEGLGTGRRLTRHRRRHGAYSQVSDQRLQTRTCCRDDELDARLRVRLCGLGT